jgi:uncharacterized protein (DUF302 family)
VINNYILYPLITLCLLTTLVSCSDEANQIYEISTKKPFADVIQDSEFAITENNFRITNRLHIGDAIQKRGNAEFPQNEVILFCNLTLAEKMLKIEPRYINYCPYKLTATESGGEIIVGTRLLPVNSGEEQMDKFAKKINKILRSMVEYAASDDPFILDKNQ